MPTNNQPQTLEDSLERIRRLEADIAHLQSHDALTGLLTRVAFFGRVDKHLAASALKPRGALIAISIRNMPRISGTLGRHVGDYVVASLASRLNQMNVPGAAKCRLGHDLFGILLSDETDALAALQCAKTVLQTVGRPLDWLDRNLNIDVAAGVAMVDGSVHDAATLSSHADLALRSALQRGGAPYAFFNPALAQNAKRRADVLQALQTASEANHMALHYQPIYAARGGALVGFEALMRMYSPELGLVPPAEFIPIAEEAGLINKLGSWALRESCRAASEWPAHLTVSVNISAEQFYAGALATDVQQALEQSAFPAYRLELEVTESAVLKDADQVHAQLAALQDIGCPLTLDDFGTGYSAMCYLWKFPFSRLKIDRAFIAALDATPMAKGILQSIFGLANHLGMKVTAEGIETEAHRRALAELGADSLQGFLLGKPAPEQDVPDIIRINEIPRMPSALRRAANG